jgi:predicted acetyltransferase
MKLIEPQYIDEHEFTEFVNEFTAAQERLVPYSIDRKGQDFQHYIQALTDESMGKELPEGWVPASTYFLVDQTGKIYGAVNIRHQLTAALRNEGGHIGYGIRPSARQQGLGTMILKLGLEKLREMGIEHVLVTCEKHNVPSAKVILANGGILDSEVEHSENKVTQRYWISVSQ